MQPQHQHQTTTKVFQMAPTLQRGSTAGDAPASPHRGARRAGFINPPAMFSCRLRGVHDGFPLRCYPSYSAVLFGWRLLRRMGRGDSRNPSLPLGIAWILFPTDSDALSRKKRIAIGEYRIRSAGDMAVVRSGGLRNSRPWRVAGSGISRNPSFALSHDGFPLRYYPSYKVKD